ncbi:peptidoglycan-binding protein [Kitasatospora sp. NPDC051853]|uniref:peptidoglycan-binding protein n=1 Tax=Kitasatospora sp. NPDC051853 TaxID=3364058 RepID=UPI003795B574
MGTADAMIAAATADLGYQEGAGNDSKHGAWYGLNHNPWCDMAVSYWADRSGNAEAVGRFAYCPDHVEFFRDRGQWVDADSAARRGDVVFYDWDEDGVADHVGLVVEDSAPGHRLTTVEGNTSPGDGGSQSNGDGCYRRSRPRGSVLGFGRPPYGSSSTSAARAADGYPGQLIRNGSTGGPVVTVQQALIHHGYGELLEPWGADGDFGDATEQGVCSFQEDRSIEVDGVVGPVTWGHLMA